MALLTLSLLNWEIRKDSNLSSLKVLPWSWLELHSILTNGLHIDSPSTQRNHSWAKCSLHIINMAVSTTKCSSKCFWEGLLFLVFERQLYSSTFTHLKDMPILVLLLPFTLAVVLHLHCSYFGASITKTLLSRILLPFFSFSSVSLSLLKEQKREILNTRMKVTLKLLKTMK